MSEKKTWHEDSEDLYSVMGLSETEKRFLDRTRTQLQYYQIHAKQYIRLKNILSILAIASSLFIAVLLTLSFTLNNSSLSRYAALALSILLAISTAYLQFFQFESKGEIYRKLANDLRKEMDHFLAGTPPYEEHNPETFKGFAKKIVEIEGETEIFTGTKLNK